MTRIEHLVAEQEVFVWAIVHRTSMYVMSLGEAERLILTHLSFRARLLEQEPVQRRARWECPWRQWLAKRYPEVPGQLRTMATALAERYPEHEREYWFKVEMTQALVELEGLTPPKKLQDVLDAGPPQETP